MFRKCMDRFGHKKREKKTITNEQRKNKEKINKQK